MKLVRLPEDRCEEAVDVFADAFRDYPVMRYIVGDVGARYDAYLRSLVGLFTESRFLRGYPVLGLESDDGRLVAAANINPPQAVPAPPELGRRREALRALLGEAAIARAEGFAAACQALEPPGLHFHLGMIGVIHAEQGRGHARPLLEAVHEMSLADPESGGVSLTTELPANLTLYEHFGYRVLGRGETADGGVVTWTLFRPDDAPSGAGDSGHVPDR